MLAVMILLLSVAPPVQADIVAACYTDCAAETDSNPDLKACLTRAANKADRLLNESYKTLQDAIRKSAQEMSQSPDEALVAHHGPKPMDRLALRGSLAFGGTATGGNYSGCLCALSYERINDFDRIRGQVMGSSPLLVQRGCCHGAKGA